MLALRPVMAMTGIIKSAIHRLAVAYEYVAYV